MSNSKNPAGQAKLSVSAGAAPSSVPTDLSAAVAAAVGTHFPECQQSLDGSAGGCHLPLSAWQLLQRRAEGQGELGESLRALTEPLNLLLPVELEPGVINLSIDGQRDEFVGCASLHGAITVMMGMRDPELNDAEASESLLACMQAAAEMNRALWLWCPEA